LFAMMGMKKRSSFALANADAGGFAIVSGVLRKPMRFVSRLARGDVEVPRFVGLYSAAAFLGATLVYGTLIGGHSPSVVKDTTSKLGFAVGEIKISGHGETSEIDILEELGLDGGTSLIGFDTEAARLRIQNMPWVASAQVTKLYPGGLSVKVSEKAAFAIWQHEDKVALVEASGKQIAAFGDEKYLDLPLIIGEGANLKAREIVEMMAAFPGIASQVKAYSLIGARRWDLQLKDGVTLKLPEKDAGAALAAVAKLESEQGFFGRDIETVDMRIGDRIIVQLSPDALSARDAAIKAFDGKKKKKAGAQI
jgi:cell division protein FtsQ